MRKIFLFIVPLLFCVFSINAQSINVGENAAISLVSASKTTLGLSAEDLGNVKVSSTYHDNGTGLTMVYLNQTYQGIPVFNQILVLAFKAGKLVSNAGVFNHSIEKFVTLKSGTPSVTAESAVQSALSDRGLSASQMAIASSTKDNGQKIEFSNMGISRDNITAQLMWTPIENSNEVRLSWHVYISPKTTADLWMVRVDATNNSILGLDNYTDYDNWGTPDVNGTVRYPGFAYNNNTNAEQKSFLNFKKSDDPSIVTTATYRVVPYPAEAPSFANGAHALRTDPWLAAAGNATTLKWHTGLTATDYDYTRGNNVFAYQDRANDNNGSVADAVTSSTAFPNLTFNHTPDYTVDPTQTTPVPNQQFNTTNLFYWNNIIHDMMYVYGFTEATANFQDENFGRGGVGNDHVNAEAQDGGGTNNANFGTPADGGSGRMQMYLWNGGTPNRDGDVDNGIVVHEYGHGISNRFTGGGSGSCLGNAEQMGEGWSDYYALMFTQDWATATLTTGFNSPRGIGTYALFQPPTGLGIRGQRYCTDFTVNNRVYLASLPAGPHPRGEIWCATLWDMTWNIITQVGTINPNLYNLAGGGGNAIAMKLVTEGLRLQQCNPGFISGRNAILQADQVLYGGLYNCAIWEAFRRRGMGAFASEGSSSSVTDQVPDFTPPITLGATVSAATIPEGSNLNYVNSVATCSAVTGYTLRDTLPANVTYVSGGTYDAPNRVVSFAVNQGAGNTNYPFTVSVNAGSYFPPISLINETVTAATIPASWTTTAPVGNVWTTSTARSRSAPNSFFSVNLAVASDQRIENTTAIALPANSYPKLSFWGSWNTEDGWDGGVVEISTNGGASWTDLGPNMVTGGYNGGLGAAPTNPLSGRSAFTGSQTAFVNTIVNLSQYAGQSVKIRFRFGSDDNTAGPTTPTGWWVDDITLDAIAAVQMRSSLFNASNVRVSFKDMITEITPVVACNATITQQPADVSVCVGSPATYTCVGTAVGGVTYQWQLSTTGIGGAYTNLANGAPYAGVTTSTLTVNPTAVGMNGNYFRCVVTGSCAPNATSNPARLSVATSSVPGTVTPANSNVCGTTNSGTLTVAGHNGTIVRWESATNIAGPWTVIVNTTTTYTFSNITQTMYYRAVSQFGTCGETNSSIATVTFTASGPMVIIADPGSTICEGDPTLLTVVNGASTPTGVLYTQTGASNNGSPSQVFEPVNTAFNSQSADDFTVPSGGSWTITQLNVVGTGTGTPTSVNVFFYANSGANLPGAAVASYNNVATFVRTGGNYAVTLPTALTLPGGTYWVSFQVNMSFATGGQWFWSNYGPTNIGNQYAWQNPGGGFGTPCAGWGYGATGCNVGGGVNRNNIFTVTGTSLTVGGPITTGTFLWSPALGLSSTTTNPVAASPMNTTTYTVNHNDGLGCVRQANITITVNKRPVVTTQPANRANCVGTTATFTVVGTGTALTYQWQESTTGCAGPWSNLTNGGIYSGVNTATLSINPVTGLMTGYAYRVILSGSCAPVNNANISNCAVLTVNSLPVVAITPALSCGGVAGINGTQLSAGTAPPPVPGSCATTSGAISIPVPDGSAAGAQATLAVSCVPANATVTGIRVNFNMPTHTYVGDMIFNIKAPNGTVLNLDKYMSGTATQAGTYPNSGFVNTTISSSGTTALGSATTTPITGTWKADLINGTIPFTIQDITGFPSTATAWSQLYSIPNGTWTLAMADGGGGDVGTLTSWSITVEYTTPGTSTSTLSYLWSPFAGLYNDPQAVSPYIGANTPIVYAAPTVFTTYTVTATNTVTGCINTAIALVNYTPPAPSVTPNPVVMCLGNPAVKLKSSSTIPATTAVWTPVTGLFSDANATIPYIAGTAVDSVWTKPNAAGVYNYQVTVQSLPTPPATVATPMAGGNGNFLVAFNVRNNNGYPVTLANIASNTFGSGAVVSRVFSKPSAIAGNPGPISAANGWIQFGTANNTVVANTLNQLMSGLTLVIPPGATYGIALDMTGATFPAYTNGTTLVTYTSGGCDIITGGNVGWGGPASPGTPANNPRNFNGTVGFVANFPACTSPATTVVVTVNTPTKLSVTLPVDQTVCTDKVATFTVAVATGTGPFTYQWQESRNGGNAPWINITNGGVYSGATTATLTITRPPITMNGYFYRAIVTGAAPCASDTSLSRRLLVNPLPTVVISNTPSYRSLLPGLTTTLSATVTPNAALSYSWLRNGVEVATTPTYLVNIDRLGSYQLRVNDVNGCSALSNIIVIKDSVSGKCFIYPNPTSGVFEVRYYSSFNDIAPRSLTIFDAKGDRVFTKLYPIGRPYDRMPVDMRAYSKGLYWVEIADVNGVRLTMCRVVIQ